MFKMGVLEASNDLKFKCNLIKCFYSTYLKKRNNKGPLKRFQKR